MAAVHANDPHEVSFEPLGGVLVQAVRPIATQTRHRQSPNLDLRGGLHVDGTTRSRPRLKHGEPFARRDNPRVPHDARPIVVHGRCESVHQVTKLDTLATCTRGHVAADWRASRSMAVRRRSGAVLGPAVWHRRESLARCSSRGSSFWTCSDRWRPGACSPQEESGGSSPRRRPRVPLRARRAREPSLTMCSPSVRSST